MSVTSPSKSQVIAIENVPRPQYSYAALAFMQITAGGSAGNFDYFAFVLLAMVQIGGRAFSTAPLQPLSAVVITKTSLCYRPMQVT